MAVIFADTITDDEHEYAIGEVVTLTGETSEYNGVMRFRTTDGIWVALADITSEV